MTIEMLRYLWTRDCEQLQWSLHHGAIEIVVLLSCAPAKRRSRLLF